MIVTPLGRVAYLEALALQEAARARVLAGGEDECLLLEHDPVVTLGRRGGVVDRAALARLDTPVVQTDRGGFATWHGPGQLVAYPIVDTRRARLPVPELVRRLGEVMVAVAAALGLPDLAYDDARPGVYREGRKLGSIGLHLTHGVTTHGLALNIVNSLDGFRAIVPCGFGDLAVSTVARELGRDDLTIDDAVVAARELVKPLVDR
ncbi:MAG: lipoyl(octanoyl) transferase LipB [Deltaproteobacteria bacterium]|nr:lipoyl(octanoyl) transferase LipB [Deltaproteobacteria bacterium]